MKRTNWHFMIFLLALLFGLATSYRTAHAASGTQGQYRRFSAQNQQVDPTPQPITPSAIGTGSSTPTPRVLPPVGKDADLVIGASVLVLIIIGGVLGSRFRRKH